MNHIPLVLLLRNFIVYIHFWYCDLSAYGISPPKIVNWQIDDVDTNIWANANCMVEVSKDKDRNKVKSNDTGLVQVKTLCDVI